MKHFFPSTRPLTSDETIRKGTLSRKSAGKESKDELAPPIRERGRELVEKDREALTQHPVYNRRHASLRSVETLPSFPTPLEWNVLFLPSLNIKRTHGAQS